MQRGMGECGGRRQEHWRQSDFARGCRGRAHSRHADPPFLWDWGRRHGGGVSAEAQGGGVSAEAQGVGHWSPGLLDALMTEVL